MCDECGREVSSFCLSRARDFEGKGTSLYGADVPTTVPRPTSTDPGAPTPSPRPWLKPIPVNTRSVAAEMEAVIAAQEPKLIRWLYSTWNAQAAALKDQEITNAVRDREVPASWEKDFHEAYAGLINSKLAPAWEEALAAGGAAMAPGIERLSGTPVDFALLGAPFQRWMKDRGNSLAVDLSAAQSKALGSLLRKQLGTEPMASASLARFIRPLVGLTDAEAGWVRNRYMAAVGVGVSEKRAVEISQNYAAFLRRRRATRIARTESAMAFNYGAFYAMQQAPVIPGDRYQKVWHVQPGIRVCDFCKALDGKVVGMEETFPGVTRLLPNVFVPPAHPHCRCTIDYELVEGKALPAKPPEVEKPKPAKKPKPAAPVSTTKPAPVPKPAAPAPVAPLKPPPGVEWVPADAWERFPALRTVAPHKGPDGRYYSRPFWTEKPKPAKPVTPLAPPAAPKPTPKPEEKPKPKRPEGTVGIRPDAWEKNPSLQERYPLEGPDGLHYASPWWEEGTKPSATIATPTPPPTPPKPKPAPKKPTKPEPTAGFTSPLGLSEEQTNDLFPSKLKAMKEGPKPIQDWAKSKLGVDLDPDKLAALSGAKALVGADGKPKTVRVSLSDNNGDLNLVGETSGVENFSRAIRPHDDGTFSIENIYFKAKKGELREGSGPAMVAAELQAVHDAGLTGKLKKIYTTAVTNVSPDDPHIGTYVWPISGFNAKLSRLTPPLQTEVRSAFPGAKDLLDVIMSPPSPASGGLSGAAWWRENFKRQRTLQCFFDPKDKRSTEVLSRYLQRKTKASPQQPVVKPEAVKPEVVKPAVVSTPAPPVSALVARADRLLADPRFGRGTVLTGEDAKIQRALQMFTSDHWFELRDLDKARDLVRRGFKWNGKTMTMEDFREAHDIMAALASRPATRTTPIFRGMGLPKDLVDRMGPGESFDHGKMTSWSVEKDVSGGFAVDWAAEQGSEPVLFIVKGENTRRGTNITRASINEGEEEFLSGGRVKILSKTWKNGLWEVEATQE